MKWSDPMKKAFKIIIPLLLTVAILFSIGWYLFVYDRNFTRDILLEQARFNDLNGNVKLAAWFYDLAYDFTGQDKNIAIELANQYKKDGNYTRAEVTLTNAIADGATAELYAALCLTYVEQDKLMDAVLMLDSITDPEIAAQLESMRPLAPVANYEPGFYNTYIPVALLSKGNKICYSLTSEYPSIKSDLYTEPFALAAGESTIYTIAVSEEGLVSHLTILSYTVGGVVEEVQFADAAMAAEIRSLLGVDEDHVLYTNDLWEITEFTVPAETQLLDDLAYLPYLKALTISDRQFEDLSFLAPMTQLEELKLTGCRIPDAELTQIASLPALRRLTLNNCGLSTITNLTGAEGLTYIDLGNNTLRHLDPLSSMIDLAEVDLQHNAISSLGALSSLTNLKKLNVSYNSITDLSPITSCTKLDHLDAGHNSLASISGIEVLTRLDYLNLEYNSLTDISPLAACTALTNLDISNNKIQHITALAPLTALQYFDFSYNNVAALPNWPADCALYSINGSHNNLDSLYALEKKENLAYIYMDYNRLTSIDILANCYKLVTVNVYGNPIHDVSALTKQNIIVNYDPTA